MCDTNSYASLYGVTIITRATYANAIVATNSASISVTGCIIYTTQTNSRGLHATYSGSITGTDVDITTLSGSCANLATDRGGGVVNASNVKLSTAGAGSPLIAVLEGGNTITITDSTLTGFGYGNRQDSSNTVVDQAGIMVYQSQSGDASDGASAFTSTNCTFAIDSPSTNYTSIPFFFTTNVNTTITMSNTTCTYSSSAYFLSALESEWGTSGSNGANVTLCLDDDVKRTTTTTTKNGSSSITTGTSCSYSS